MEKVKICVTRRYLQYGSITGGILAVIMLILYFTAGGSMEDVSALSEALPSLRTLCVVFYLDMILLIIVTGGYAFRIGRLGDTGGGAKVSISCEGLALLMGILFLPVMRVLHALARNDFASALACSDDLDDRSILLLMMISTQLAAAKFAAYHLFMKQSEDTDLL
ncbi:hypothetical protein MKA38_08935 [[Clostridium] innocuum]|nr:hypothetical protein [[Clostridium] innocuum]